MSEGPIKREREAWKPLAVSTTNAARVCAPSATVGRGYCGRRSAPVSRASLDEVTCADCIAALVADTEHHESGGSES